MISIINCHQILHAYYLYGHTQDRCTRPVVSAYAAWHQMVPICTEWWCTRLTKQPKLTAIIQSRRLTLFGHIMCMDVNADAKRILLASPPADWRRQLSRARITWLSTIQQDLKQHLMLPEAADLAQNRRLWRLRNRELHARNDDDDLWNSLVSWWRFEWPSLTCD